MVSVCLPSDALLQHLQSYLGFSYLGRGVSLHGCSSKAQPLLLTFDRWYLLTAALPDLQLGIAPLGPPAPVQPPLLGCGKSVLNIHWKDWCWSWNSSTLAIWCEELTHLKRPCCWESLKSGGEGDDRGWDGWMSSITQWTWVWVNSGSCRWTRGPGVLRSMGLQRVGQDWATELTDNLKVASPVLHW